MIFFSAVCEGKVYMHYPNKTSPEKMSDNAVSAPGSETFFKKSIFA